MKRITMCFAAVGIVVPLIVIAWDLVSPGNYPNVVRWFWPTMILLMPFGTEPYGPAKLATAAISVLLNGVLYALIGLVIAALADRSHHRKA